MKFIYGVFLILTVMLWAGCTSGGEKTPANATITNSVNSAQPTASDGNPDVPETISGNGDFVASETGIEKQKPAEGKANVQGKVLYNEKPQAGIEVKLCESFSQFYGGCSGENFVTKTDANGEYLLANVTPKVYQGLLIKVFNTKNYIFATQGFGISSAEYKLDADKTFFAPASNLFKDDLKLQSPKDNAKVSASDLTIKWEAYPEAVYYKLYLTPEEYDAESNFAESRIEANEYKVNKTLKAGGYTLRLEAFNNRNIKLAELREDITFNVSDDSAPN